MRAVLAGSWARGALNVSNWQRQDAANVMSYAVGSMQDPV
jgi:hypothetical protein